MQEIDTFFKVVGEVSKNVNRPFKTYSQYRRTKSLYNSIEILLINSLFREGKNVTKKQSHSLIMGWEFESHSYFSLSLNKLKCKNS